MIAMKAFDFITNKNWEKIYFKFLFSNLFIFFGDL